MKDQNYKLTPTLSCLKSALQQMNSFNIKFSNVSTMFIVAKDCKDELIESVVVKHRFPVPRLESSWHHEGYITISARLISGDFMDDYALICQKEHPEVYAEAVQIFIDHINEG